MIKFIKKLIYSKIPLIGRLYGAIFNKKGFYTFSGWGLTTTASFPPWINISNNKEDLNNIFLEIDKTLRKKLKSNQFIATEHLGFKKLEHHDDRLDYLKWRHYLIFISTLYAAQLTKSKNKILVECGAADGISAFYAINALKRKKIDFKCYLYDSWGPMKKKFLNKIELKSFKENKYNFLNFEIIKKNYKSEKKVEFIKGYLPSTLKNKNLKNISWLSIDLNSAKPTIDVLNHFYNKIEIGGIIILDDYGGAGYIETKKAVDKFFQNKKSIVFQLPTGQAIIQKS